MRADAARGGTATPVCAIGLQREKNLDQVVAMTQACHGDDRYPFDDSTAPSRLLKNGGKALYQHPARGGKWRYPASLHAAHV